MEAPMHHELNAILQRRAVKVFDTFAIPADTRDQILNAARFAPSSFNIQPYRLYWIESSAPKEAAAKLCHGQRPAKTASALVVAVADIGSWQSTTQSHLQWVRTSSFTPEKISEFQKRSKFAKWFFVMGWFNLLGALKWLIFRLINLWKALGMPPVSRQGLFKWATKNTSLACENLMIAAEALGLNTCPMEGFDGRRLSKLLGLSSRVHEIVLVIAVGKKSAGYVDHPQWRRPFDDTVIFL
jgi:nitroreductase